MSDKAIRFTIGEDGTAKPYDDTWDIVLHCDSEQDHDEVERLLLEMHGHDLRVNPSDLPKDGDFVLVLYSGKGGNVTHVHTFGIADYIDMEWAVYVHPELEEFTVEKWWTLPWEEVAK